MLFSTIMISKNHCEIQATPSRGSAFYQIAQLNLAAQKYLLFTNPEEEVLDRREYSMK